MTFAEAASSVAVAFTTDLDVESALLRLGADARVSYTELPPTQRAALVDRFVRNLKRVGVQAATEVYRELLSAVDAKPGAQWYRALADSTSLVDLRNYTRYVLTALGLPWDQLSRVQSCICAVGRWICSSGGGQLSVKVDSKTAHFLFETAALGTDAELVRRSPLVSALGALADELRVRPCDGVGLEIEFKVGGP